MDVAGHVRPNGTFAHPNGAAMFMAVAAIVSLWRYLDVGRHSSDAVLTALFCLALIATYSIDGLVTVVAMLVILGAFRSGAPRSNIVPFAMAAALVLVFLATPLGSARIASESNTSLASAERGEANSTLAWRLNKWKTLLLDWEASPLYGQGLGTTVTEAPILGNEYAGDLPHNEYLRYLVETGVVGLAILAFGLMLLFRSMLQRRTVNPTATGGAFNAPLLGLVVLAGCMVNALADNTVLYSTVSYAVALIIGAVLCLPVADSVSVPAAREPWSEWARV
jgi:O-antigen ligase